MLRPAMKAAAQVGNPVAPMLCDANAFADVLGVSPAYRQKETIRWNSALLMYKQMSSQDLMKSCGDAITPTRHVSMSACTSPVQLLGGPNHGGVTSSSDYSFLTPSSCLTSNVASSTQAASTAFEFPSSSNSQLPGLCGAGTMNDNHLTTSPTFENLLRNVSRQKESGRVEIGDDLKALVSAKNSGLNALELEAIAAVHELQFAVKDVFVSELLPRTSDLIFLNMTTAEGQPYCVELTSKGWRVTSRRHDCMNGDIAHIHLHTKYFETIYALMDAISDRFRARFSKTLADKLATLQERTDDSASDWDPQPNCILPRVQPYVAAAL